MSVDMRNKIVTVVSVSTGSPGYRAMYIVVECEKSIFIQFLIARDQEPVYGFMLAFAFPA